jgi:hypothetical protein
MLSVLKRAKGIARHILFAGAVALLVAGWSGVALATPPGSGDGGDVPEISLSAIGGTMTLLVVGLLLLREGLRTRPTAE